MIEPVKKGIYIAGRALGTERRESELLANHILGLSYDHKSIEKISDQHRAIYIYQPATTFYAFGLATANLSKDQQVIMAIPEKAL